MHPFIVAVYPAGTKTRMTFERKIDVYLSIEAVNSLWGDARHDMRDAVQRECLADDLRIGGEMILPVPVSQNHSSLGGLSLSAEARSAYQRHTDCLEIVRGDEHYLFGFFFDFALSVGPARERHAGIGGSQIDVVRIGPVVGRLARAYSL